MNLYVGPGFPGLIDNGYYPSDAQIAMGPVDIVEMTNTLVAVYARSGSWLAVFPMTKILGIGNNDSLADPQIAWDQTSGRWIATAMDLSLDATEVSFSNTSDPQGGWFDYSFPFGSTLYPDQPRLGFSSTVVVVATELFNGICHSDNLSAVQAPLRSSAEPARGTYQRSSGRSRRVRAAGDGTSRRFGVVAALAGGAEVARRQPRAAEIRPTRASRPSRTRRTRSG